MWVIPLRDTNPTRRLPYVTYLLIVLNLGFFAYQYLMLSPLENQAFISRHGMIPMFLLSGYGPSLSTLVTSVFMHAGLWHLVFNLLYLHIFGDNVEDAFGHLLYVVFYLACGIVACAAQALSDPGSQLPLIGASGAISGVLGAYLILFPGARVLSLAFIFLIEARAVFFILVYFALNVYQAFNEPVGGRVAFFAHLGGFVAGVLWLIIFGKPRLTARTYLGGRVGHNAAPDLQRRA